ncbi:MAG: hypothetical protein ACXVAY_01440 [Mucilaginibacter sp.]
MPEKQLKTFVVNDENVVNSYGFRVRNAGINFARFDANPVMLDSHINTTKSVMGNWKNRRIEGSQLLMDANFDSEDPDAKAVEGKVERDFVKGASLGLGISFDEDSFERQPDGIWDLIVSELMETSVCGVPSLSSALSLYNKATGELIAEDQIKLTVQKLTTQKINPKYPDMEKIILTPGALSALLGAGVSNADNVAEISRGIEKLQIELAAEKQSAADWKKKCEDNLKLQAAGLVDAAVLETKILKEDREQWVIFAIGNYELASKQIAMLKSATSLSDQVQRQEGASDVKTVDDFEKLSDEKKLAFKTNHADAYKKLMAL